MQNSKPYISSVLALSVAISGFFALASQDAFALTKGDGVAPLKEDAYSYRRLAMKYFTDGDDTRCLESYQKAIDLASKDSGPTSSYVSDLYFEMGCAAKQRAKFATAEHCFLEALKHRPNSIPARLQLASVYTSEGKRNEAFGQIKAAKMKNPHSPQAQGALVAYIQGMNRPAEAAREASLIKAMLPGAAKVGAAGISHFDGLTELKAPAADSSKAKAAAKEPAKELVKEPARSSAKEAAKESVKENKEISKPAQAETKNSQPKESEAKYPAASASTETHMPASLSSGSVLRGLMHGTANRQPQQPAAPAPIVTPVTPPVQAPTLPKVDDKELELAKAKAQLELMRKKLEAAEQNKSAKEKHDSHEQSKHSDNHKKHEKEHAKHQGKSHEDVATDVGERAAVLQTKAVMEKSKKGNAFNRVQSNVPSDKSSGDSSHSDGGGENVVQTSDLRHLKPPEGVIAPQYVPIQMPAQSAPKKTKGHGTSMVPPPPPTPVFGGPMPMMQQPMMQQERPKAKPKPVVRPKPAEEESVSSPSPKSNEEDTKFLLDWGGAGDKHKRKSRE